MARGGREDDGGPDPGARAISGTMTGVVVAYVRLVEGDAGVERLLELAGGTRSVEALTDATAWVGYGEAVRLFEAADAVIGTPAARRIGAHVLEQYAGSEVADILRSLGSPEAVLENVATTAAKYSAVTSMDVLEAGDGHARVAAVTREGVTRDRHFCDYSAGVLSQASVLFGYGAADVAELECQTRGDGRCLYEVRWRRATDDDADAPERRIRHLESQLAGVTSRMEALQATATAFITAGDADEVLAIITRRAGLAVRAPRFLLAVQLPSEPRLRVHHEGFGSEEEARLVAREILSGAMTGRTTHLVVDVVSARSRFGVLAAIHPDGTAFFPQERHLLEAYAGHAAAALEVTASLDEARRQNGTARALLGFGRSLSHVATVDEIVERLTEALPAVVDCDSGAVLLWDDATEVMSLRSTFGLRPEIAATFVGLEVRGEDTPAIATLVRDRRTVFTDSSTDDPFLAGLVALAEMQSAAIVPIVVQDSIVGVVTVGRRDTEIRSRPDVLERLEGMADLAATAFVNARFLESVQTEAFQDPLTGLANARLLARAAERALAAPATSAGNSVALLFVDLDGFKPINDEYGHSAGDDVLRTCGLRLESGAPERHRRAGRRRRVRRPDARRRARGRRGDGRPLASAAPRADRHRRRRGTALGQRGRRPGVLGGRLPVPARAGRRGDVRRQGPPAGAARRRRRPRRRRGWRASAVGGGLQPVELGVRTTACHQLLVRSRPPPPRRRRGRRSGPPSDGAEAVRHEDRDAPVVVRLPGSGGVPLEQRVLRLRIQRRRRFVEHEHERVVAHEPPRQRELLPLSERDLDATRGRPAGRWSTSGPRGAPSPAARCTPW